MKIIKEDVLVLLSIGSLVLANFDHCSAGHTGITRGREF